ncbi:bifunctional indole-3-glycerol-phosphate synthase TrpC/phosphoribosylanthranilate isomerase TrpF [Aliiglaciecola sp. CAU 1673]|uniref:bifunctional indole-3-glycerol-phosphate synthase TrpC/phosphoribosylanthranilate isomerase TrpF n=1 Tax=Aliiglaciecola sp. CAU 1673 TaxID=3032595 RepID=UPI0023DB86AE|nr:bifunctional indole-3-glycerol-phosphate synthase TrpC/phosphoribosylanthranilate isomerase TrpF [Aliiglaciecola sp. CAU 1673]MDF2178780.1 bifunctional indole-3-glycerol-phosphate synthase TrpC/phosphoribosylanthranilate isomerase TrpF [Aliiglaciecola sp. CAU 1673]
MANVLDNIIAHKRQEVEARKAALPLEEFIGGLTPSTKSLEAALAKPVAGFIFECKKASPSKSLIRDPFLLDEILDAYKPYAAAISVLTDERYFQGSYENLAYVTARVDQPVLNKDFFIDPYQVYLARHANADAILLMLSVLDDKTYLELSTLAEKYQLDVLTEVSNEEETHRAVALGARIIGINNRNLRDLSTDLATTERLAALIPEDRLIVSESGIYTHSDVLRLAPVADGFLVGSSLMAQANLCQAVRKLLFGEVKVCGLTRPADAALIKSLGASYGGLIFAPSSKRCISIEKAVELVAAVPFDYVGVFVDAPIEEIVGTAQKLQLAAVQLHGQEDQAYIESLRTKLPAKCQIWKACGVQGQLPALNLEGVDKYLLDCQIGQQMGGTGRRFNWSLLEDLSDKSVVGLAGGLSPDNIVAARNTEVGLLDINSGVEIAPGIKDAEKLAQLFTTLREY